MGLVTDCIQCRGCGVWMVVSRHTINTIGVNNIHCEDCEKKAKNTSEQTLSREEISMTKDEQIEVNTIVDFKLTASQGITTPVLRGILRRYCTGSGWQSVYNSQRKTTSHFPVKLAVVEVPIFTPEGPTLSLVRVDVNCILGCTDMTEVR